MRYRWMLAGALLAGCAAGQQQPQQPQQPMPGMQHDMHQMPGMQGMQGMHHDMHGMQMNEAGMFLMNQASGTSRNPESWPMPMLMPRWGSWNLMLMGQAFLVETQQSGARGGDKFYSPNWFMAGAEHQAGRGSFMIQAMLSLDPATITHRRYPLLFQTGEEAFGRPIVDGQHPHNFIMGLGVHYARPLGENTMLQAYFAPVGDPALGPVAFPHRASAMELPQAGLGHHWQDSTHIAADVVTVGLKHKWVRIEASGFHGKEPGENRWTIEQGAIDSWSGRLSVAPGKNWLAQVSAGRLAHPEEHGPGDVVRATASVHYTRPLSGGAAWSTSVIWGRNHNTASRRDTNSFLAETVAPVRGHNFVTGRFEVVDKDELFSDNHELEHELEHSGKAVFRIGAYTAGVTHDFAGLIPGVQTGVGANFTAYTLPREIQPYYGNHPFGVNVFVRLRLKGKS